MTTECPYCGLPVLKTDPDTMLTEDNICCHKCCYDFDAMSIEECAIWWKDYSEHQKTLPPVNLHDMPF